MAKTASASGRDDREQESDKDRGYDRAFQVARTADDDHDESDEQAAFFPHRPASALTGVIPAPAASVKVEPNPDGDGGGQVRAYSWKGGGLAVFSGIPAIALTIFGTDEEISTAASAEKRRP